LLRSREIDGMKFAKSVLGGPRSVRDRRGRLVDEHRVGPPNDLDRVGRGAVQATPVTFLPVTSLVVAIAPFSNRLVFS
jgi:hypothetical protein